MTIKPQIVEKENTVNELREYMSEASVSILADYRGLTVAQVTDLRSKLRDAGITYKVAKNTLLKRAAKELGISELDPHLEGPTAVVFSKDPVAAAKIITEFAKSSKKLEIKAGLLDRKAISPDDIKDLAALPPREVLLAKALGAMQSPMYGFAGSLQGVLRKFVYALDQIREQKAGA